MRREKINKIKKKKVKSKTRTVRVIFKKNGGRKTRRKVDNKMKELNRLTRKQIVKKLRKKRIKTNRGSPTSILRDILFYKETTGINIVKDI
jgi:hypothetical protein|tara:strand:- start:99 stop:371 length:273 start_codon:yes stop_codon:yes gene_type:complete